MIHNRTKMRHLVQLLLLGFVYALTPMVQAAKLYKWVDENGEVRYSDQIPPSQIKQKHQTLNAQGIVIENKEAAKTEAQIAAEAIEKKKLEEKLAEEKHQKQIQDEKDRVLMMTFSSEAELTRVRDNRLDVLESVIRLIEKSIATAEEKLIRLEKNARDIYLSKGLEVPGGLAQNIEQSTRRIANRNAQLALKVAEKDKIIEQYELDLKRYRLLTAD